ncbi:MAG: thiamine phosphate synthase [Clostridiales bacterium]|nr:thiamine phosphate synthase [Clostridiales bacterium]
MNVSRENFKLYAITDRRALGGRSLVSAVEEAVSGGAGIVQIREKGLSFEEFLEEASLVKKVTDKYGVPLIINDSTEVCLRIGASGVHIGQKDTDIITARRILGEKSIIGVSAKTVEQALYAEENGADYLGVGAAFSTGSKADASTIDHRVYGEITKAVNIPVVAIGGITAENMSSLEGSGIDGVAVISALFGKPDIKAAAEELKRLSGLYFKK